MELDFVKASELFDNHKLQFIRKIFLRDGLDLYLRAVSCIACLQSTGAKKDLTSFLMSAIGDRNDFEIAYEVLLQGYLFCGYPRAIESFFCLRESMEQSGKPDGPAISFRPLDLSDELLSRGAAVSRAVHGDKIDKIRNKISALSPDLGYLMIAEGYGHILSRRGLDLKTRELAVVSSISAIGSVRQLNSHIRGCRNVGCGDKEIFETIFTGLLWLPADRIIESLGVWSAITGLQVPESIADFNS